jgi:hypothetical protein
MHALHKLQALRQMCLDQGVIAAGEVFECDMLEADDLITRGLAQWAQPPRLPAPEPEPLALIGCARQR